MFGLFNYIEDAEERKQRRIYLAKFFFTEQEALLGFEDEAEFLFLMLKFSAVLLVLLWFSALVCMYTHMQTVTFLVVSFTMFRYYIYVYLCSQRMNEYQSHGSLTSRLLPYVFTLAQNSDERSWEERVEDEWGYIRSNIQDNELIVLAVVSAVLASVVIGFDKFLASANRCQN